MDHLKSEFCLTLKQEKKGFFLVNMYSTICTTLYELHHWSHVTHYTWLSSATWIDLTAAPPITLNPCTHIKQTQALFFYQIFYHC